MADSAEKTFAPPPSRRRKAQEQGEIARSQDLTIAFSFIGAALALEFGAKFLAISMSSAMARCFMLGDRSFYGSLKMFAPAIAIAGVIALAACAAGILGTIVQGLVVAPSRLAPQLERLSPLEYFKRLFSTDIIVNLAKAALKTALVGVIAWRVAINCARMLPPRDLMAQLLALREAAAKILGYTGGLMLAIAVLDYAYSYYRHEQKLKLTRDEFRQEMKEEEGNPHVKRRRLRLMRRRRKNGLAQAHTASVVLINPAHYAVALRYRRGYDRAPVCVAKGAGESAARIIGIARMGAIPVVQNPPLCRALFRGVEVGEQLSVQFYQAVAEILTALMRAELATRAGAGGGGS
ncbi:MAG: EscU/YscU/HrcU family type III secretion system export apparatus switch protein [Candidatus Binataceae bacterium]